MDPWAAMSQTPAIDIPLYLNFGLDSPVKQCGYPLCLPPGGI